MNPMLKTTLLGLACCVLQACNDQGANNATPAVNSGTPLSVASLPPSTPPSSLSSFEVSMTGDPALGSYRVTTPTPDVVRFIAMGDSGSGYAGQIATGDAMRQVCLEAGLQRGGSAAQSEQAVQLGCQFVLGFGDNVYETGAQSAKDPLFFDKFEKAYLTLPSRLPFFMVLGNHDNTGLLGTASQDQASGIDTDTLRGDFQVDYTRQPVDTTGKDAKNPKKTPRWQMPRRYYDFSAGGTDAQPLIQFFALDSITATSTIPDANGKYAYDGYGQEQLRWLQKGLNTSAAKFKVAMAHHPYLSNGSHGNAGEYEGLPNQLLPMAAGQRYKEFLEEAMCDRADVFMTGHDHDLQWLTAVPTCGRTEFLLSGAAGKNDRDLKDFNRNLTRIQRGARWGFFWVEVSRDAASQQIQMTARMYSVKLNPNGPYVVQPRKIDGSADGQPIRYELIEEDPNASLSDRQKKDRQAYLIKHAQPAVMTLLQKPREFPVFSGRVTTGTQDCQAVESVSTASLSTQGPLDKVQTLTMQQFEAAATQQTEPAQARLVRQLGQLTAQVMDVHDTLLKGALESVAVNNPAYAQARMGEAYRQAALQVQQIRMKGEQTFGVQSTLLPAPLNQLGAAFSQQNTRIQAADCGQGDLSAVVAPLVGLSRNLANIAEAAQGQGGSVPVVGGALKTLADTLNNTTQLFAQTGPVRLSLVNDRLMATTDQLFRNLLADLLPLQSNTPANPLGLSPVGVSTLGVGLLTAATREVTAQLDRGLRPATDPLLMQLSKVGLLTGAP